MLFCALLPTEQGGSSFAIDVTQSDHFADAGWRSPFRVVWRAIAGGESVESLAEHGAWLYEDVSNNGIGVRTTADYPGVRASCTGEQYCSKTGAVCLVVERRLVHIVYAPEPSSGARFKTCPVVFLRLANGDGWIFDYSPDLHYKVRVHWFCLRIRFFGLKTSWLCFCFTVCSISFFLLHFSLFSTNPNSKVRLWEEDGEDAAKIVTDADERKARNWFPPTLMVCARTLAQSHRVPLPLGGGAAAHQLQRTTLALGRAQFALASVYFSALVELLSALLSSSVGAADDADELWCAPPQLGACAAAQRDYARAQSLRAALGETERIGAAAIKNGGRLLKEKGMPRGQWYYESGDGWTPCVEPSVFRYTDNHANQTAHSSCVIFLVLPPPPPPLTPPLTPP